MRYWHMTHLLMRKSVMSIKLTLLIRSSWKSIFADTWNEKKIIKPNLADLGPIISTPIVGQFSGYIKVDSSVVLGSGFSVD